MLKFRLFAFYLYNVGQLNPLELKFLPLGDENNNKLPCKVILRNK